MNKKNNQEEKNLMNRWVFDHANAMMDEFNMNRSEAFRRAHLARELLEKLGQGKVTFQYMKKNGDLREAMGTLRWGIDPTTPTRPPRGEDSVTPPRRRRREPDSLNFTYWDLEKHGFRTFSAARIVKIIAVAIPNYKEVVEHVSPDLIEFV